MLESKRCNSKTVWNFTITLNRLLWQNWGPFITPGIYWSIGVQKITSESFNKTTYREAVSELTDISQTDESVGAEMFRPTSKQGVSPFGSD